LLLLLLLLLLSFLIRFRSSRHKMFDIETMSLFFVVRVRLVAMVESRQIILRMMRRRMGMRGNIVGSIEIFMIVHPCRKGRRVFSFLVILIVIVIIILFIIKDVSLQFLPIQTLVSVDR
jgi:uncharacterized membrane protein